MMRVVIISQYYPPDMGGGATRAYNAARGLILAGCDVTVVAAFPHYPSGIISKPYRRRPFVLENSDSIRIIRTFVPPLKSEGLAKRIILFLSFMLSSLIALFYINKADVVWSANPNVTSIFPGIIYRFIHKCPLVQNVDDLWPEVLFDLGESKKSLIGRASKTAARISYNKVDAITPISPAYVDVIRKDYGISTDKIQVLRAGVDLSRFQHIEMEHSENHRFIVLYIGAFSPTYNFDQVFEAAASLVSDDEISFVLQGGGEVIKHLRRLETQMNLPNIRVVSKIVSREEVVNVMKSADALLLPLSGFGSIERGISSKLYEYQAIGKPILCCSNGQPGIYVAESKSGIVVQPGDSKALSQSVLLLKNNPAIAHEYGDNGKSYVERNLGLLNIGKELKSLFGNLIISRRNAPEIH